MSSTTTRPASVSADGSFRGVKNAKRTPLPASALFALMGWWVKIAAARCPSHQFLAGLLAAAP
jgi:hypothetical protein